MISRIKFIIFLMWLKILALFLRFKQPQPIRVRPKIDPAKFDDL